MERSLEVGRSFPNERPNPVGLIHHNIVDFACTKIFVRCSRHLKVFTEEHDFERSVGSMSHLDHLVAEKLPRRVHSRTDQRREKTKAEVVNGIILRSRLITLKPLDHLVCDPGHQAIISLQHDAHDDELDEVRFVGGEQTLTECHAVIRVFVDVVLDGFLYLLLLVLDFKFLR